MKHALITSIGLVAAGFLSGCSEPAPESAADPMGQTSPNTGENDRAREEAAAALEVERLAALWSYNEVPVGQDRQLTAAIYSTNDVDTDNEGARRVRLVFRDHPSWGRSSYLVLQGGDFDCYDGCAASVTVDEAAATPMAATRPRTDDAIAMFIDEAEALWHLTAGATSLSVEFPVALGGTRTATFEVSGLDRSRMPGWD